MGQAEEVKTGKMLRDEARQREIALVCVPHLHLFSCLEVGIGKLASGSLSASLLSKPRCWAAILRNQRLRRSRQKRRGKTGPCTNCEGRWTVVYTCPYWTQYLRPTPARSFNLRMINISLIKRLIHATCRPGPFLPCTVVQEERGQGAYQ